MALRAEYEQYRFHDVFDAKANVGQVTGGVVVAFRVSAASFLLPRDRPCRQA
jgi:hypothetical protein